MKTGGDGGGGGKAPASGKAQHKTPASALEIDTKAGENMALLWGNILW